MVKRAFGTRIPINSTRPIFATNTASSTSSISNTNISTGKIFAASLREAYRLGYRFSLSPHSTRNRVSRLSNLSNLRTIPSSPRLADQWGFPV